MKINTYFKEMRSIKKKVNKMQDIQKVDPGKKDALKGFLGRAKYAIKLIFLEKEIITFALLQWICVVLGYYLSIQIIGWIPDEIWGMVETESDDFYETGVHLVFAVWLLLCIGITAYPIGILTACMGVSHFLHKQGQESTIAHCLNIVMPSALSIWILHWIDGWWTVDQILKRLPGKKRMRRTSAQILLSEALYYSWKIGLTAILPILITGKGLFDSGKNSIRLIKNNTKDIIILRMGYSFLCWIIGIVTFIGSIYFIIQFPDLFFQKEQGMANELLSFYTWVGIPILIPIAIIMLFLRPIYIISACDIYSDFITEKKEKLILPKTPSTSINSLIIFVILCVIILSIFIFRHKLGLN